MIARLSLVIVQSHAALHNDNGTISEATSEAQRCWVHEADI
jgi:hypothetical protein